MAIPKMTMQEVEKFLQRNKLHYTVEKTADDHIEWIEARAYLPNKFVTRFYKEQSDEERGEEIGSIMTIHKLRQNQLE